jgi:hypothetical protein
VFSFGALLNAFGMVSPMYALGDALSASLGLTREAPVLGIIFIAFLVVEPLVLLGTAAWLTRKFGGSRKGLLPLAVRYAAYGLAPLGFAVWLSHYSFHFLTGFFTFIPVFQSAAAGFGWPVLGEPRWHMSGLPVSSVYPVELGFLALGLVGSLIVMYRLAEDDSQNRPFKTFAPWAGLCILLWLSALWLMSQPMEMRGTFLAG